MHLVKVNINVPVEWIGPEEEKLKNLSIAHTVEEIYLTGGEPTVIKTAKVVRLFYRNGLQNIRLKYNTNLVKALLL